MGIGRKVDPRVKQWWGQGGTMKAVSSLTPLQKYVLLEGGTEDDTDDRQFVNGYPWDNEQKGVYVSAVSGVPLFSSTAKLTDARGWPGFSGPINMENVIIRPDPKDVVVFPDCEACRSREVVDRASMTHLGHLVDDIPSGEHYCINAASLRFIPGDTS